jgi:hypothetical protein
MIDAAANKATQEDVQPQPVQQPETPKVEVGAQVGEDTEYHFAGSGEFYPVAVRAKSIEQAAEVWRARRVRIHPE